MLHPDPFINLKLMVEKSNYFVQKANAWGEEIHIKSTKFGGYSCLQELQNSEAYLKYTEFKEKYFDVGSKINIYQKIAYYNIDESIRPIKGIAK
jgi:hypothetical protein